MEAEERIGKNEREQSDRKDTRLLEIHERERNVADEVRVIEDGNQRHRVHSGAEDNGRHDQRGNGGKHAKNKMDPPSQAAPILEIYAQEIRDLRHTEEDQPRDALLDRQKNEEKVRADRADKTELREEPRARAIRHDGTKQARRDNTNVRKEGESGVVHEVDNRQLHRREDHDRGDQLLFILEWRVYLGHDFSCGA